MNDPIKGNWTDGNEFSLSDFRNNLLKFGNTFLDKAMRGIFPDDLILIGAPTGSGKTQFCVNLALANVRQNKKVHFIALEASKDEIQKRLAFTTFAGIFYDDKNRKKIGKPLNYQDFVLGEFNTLYNSYKDKIDLVLNKYKNLHIHYGGDDFTVDDLVRRCVGVSHETDLIIVDHVHYFDFDEKENENSALKKIAKTARKLTQELQKPIILVAHLRKRDKFNQELCPGIDEFHGSSDLTKIATKVITLARLNAKTSTRTESIFRILKNRNDGSVCFYVAKQMFSSTRGNFDNMLSLGSLERDGKKFNPIHIGDDTFPYWFE